jgi:Protein of unknown function (DUF1592)/Protein of unknown function (DUF1588)/Protein of unknown function (DUF1595)/Protein of unknown function (DUF1587)/Protein of unknown function (DUF1585)
MKTSALWRVGIAQVIVASALGSACGRVSRDLAPPAGEASAGAGGELSSDAAAGSDDSAGAAGSAGATSDLPLHDESAGPLVMRRLTNREYSNIIADLLGDVTDPGASFAVDGPIDTGFEAPSSVSELNVQDYSQAADTLAETALASGKLGLPAMCSSPPAELEESCATQFISAFGGNAFRRPISTDEAADLLVLFHVARDPAPAGGALSFSESIAQVAKGMLQSPNFLYHWELGPVKPVLDATTQLVPLTPYQIAARLSEMLWESMPDAALLSAATAGELATPEQIQSQAARLLSDPRAARALFNFHEQWLLQAGGQMTDLSKLTKSSAAFTPALAQSLAGEFTNFLTSVYGPAGDGTLNTLLTAPYTYANTDIAALYGNTTVTGSEFTRIQLDPGERSGILTQAAFLAANADADADNPIKRGLVVYTRLLCGEAVPPANTPALPSPVDTETTRQRFERATQGVCASACHGRIDPPGFAFENYDAIGAYRSTESGQPVDASGTFTTPAGSSITFQNAVDLSSNLAQSSEVQACVNRQWLRYTLGRMESDAEQGSLERAQQRAAQTAGFSLREMLLGIVGSVSFRYRAPSPGEAP